MDEDFRPEQFYKESKGLKAGRLSDLVRGGEVCLFKGNGSRFSVSVENLSSACAVNKSVKGESQSSLMNAVRLLILQGWETVIKGMFVQDPSNPSYEDRITSGMHQIRIYINAEQKTITVDDFVPSSNDLPACNMTTSQGELWISILEKAFAKLF